MTLFFSCIMVLSENLDETTVAFALEIKVFGSFRVEKSFHEKFD